MTQTVATVTPTVYRVPTPTPEGDGTLTWDATTVVTCLLEAGGRTGLGWTYSSPAAAVIITEHLAPVLIDHDLGDIAGCYARMRRACRNLGTKGLVMQAISAVDIALWDLLGRTLGVPVNALLGGGGSVRVYGSGGFTTFDDRQLAVQVEAWSTAGCTAMKIKIGESWGTAEDRDLARVARFAELAGPGVQLMVDANGGYGAGQARRIGEQLDRAGVVWFEEPVSSDDPTGLGLVRAALRCDVAAGEYLSEPQQAAALCLVVDCLQLDATRCGGYTGWLACARVAAAAQVPVSAHCAPALHAALAGTVEHLRHLEWFADHARLEPILFDGVPRVLAGTLTPFERPGHGMSVSGRAAEYRVG